MPIMDVFNGDAFTFTSLTAAVDKFGYAPGYLGSIPGLFQDVPIRTEEVWIEERSNAPALIQTTARGTPPKQKSGDIRDARAFKTTRIAISSRITARELQGIRRFGSEIDIKDLAEEVSRRMFKITQDIDITEENMRLGCVQGLVTDADGSTIANWATNMNQAIPGATAFNLATLIASGTEGAFLKICNGIRRVMIRNLKGLGGNRVQVHAIADDQFWDLMLELPEIRHTYQYAMAAKELQNDFMGAWDSFYYGKIMWHNYRGTDDNSTVAVPAGTVKFFPANAGIFQVARAPSESFEFVNTPGQKRYARIIIDRERDSWADPEVMTYPLHVCTMPSALASGTM
jgi:hypothetical protein